MTNDAYIDFLETTARRMQLLGENTFRVRAYSRAARALEGISDSISDCIDNGTITDIEGIGKGIASELAIFKKRGTTDDFEALKNALPAHIDDLFQVQGLGPKRIQTLWKSLGIGSLPELKEAADSGQIATLPGMGKKTVENIQKELQRLESYQGRVPLADVIDTAQSMLQILRESPDVERAEVAGSYRRGRITVGDLDIVAASTNHSAVMELFTQHPNVKDVVGRGDTKATVRLHSGLACDLRVVDPESFATTLHHFTGSKDHNIALRQRATKRNLRVNEYGVFRLDKDGEVLEQLSIKDENDVYRALELPFIPPELREDRGEIEAAERNALPKLPTLDDIVSDLHMHTTYSDGRTSVREMALAAQKKGLKFICITDHSQSLHIANGLDRDRLLQQIEEIDQVNKELDGIRVLKGLEVDILADGSLDMDDETLSKLDWVIGSVHQWTRQPVDEMTSRVLRAVRSGFISALGHPTGRLIGRREGYAIDLDPILEACAEEGVAVEINASPQRLDLDSSIVKKALEIDDLWFTVNTDAHSIHGLDDMIFGLKNARRGWLPAARIVNTLEYEDFVRTIRSPGRS